MNKNRFGIWMDKRRAIIIKLQTNGKPQIKIIKSNIEDYHPVGGARSKVAWGPVDSVSESKYLARKEQQLKRYFTNIIGQFEDQSNLYLFGPAEAKIRFREFIRNFKSKRIEVEGFESSDTMTENQMVAKVREFFKD